MKIKTHLIGWAIYLTGCVCSYIICKYNMKQATKEYTVGDRTVAIFISSTSWLGFCAMGIVYIMQNTDGSEPANW